MGKLIEGLWDCKYCKTTGIGGSKRECPNCGKPRDENTKFYMPGEITYVPEEEASKINRNPDWICAYCNSLNSASYSTCQSCGSERTSENHDYFTNKKTEESENCENSEKYEESENCEEQERHEESEIHEETQGHEESEIHEETVNTSDAEEILNESFGIKLKHKVIDVADEVICFIEDSWTSILLMLSIVALIVGLVYIFIPKNQEITINSFNWERSIQIERYQTVDESGWSLPEGARLHNSKKEIYAYEQVLDHYENRTRQVAKQRISGYEEYVTGYRDLGNGYFEEITAQRPIYETYYETEHYQEPVYRSEPIYKTKYYYEIDKWLYDRTLTTSGYDQNPYWEDVSALKKDERVSTRNEKYYINGTTAKGKSKEISIPYEEWKDLAVGDTVNIKVSIFENGKLN